jgi:hypothetical protein
MAKIEVSSLRLDTLEYKPNPPANHIGLKASVKDGYWGATERLWNAFHDAEHL